MPTWNESEYVRRANDVAREFVTTKKPLNDLCEKVARDESMNPDEIRTLVRLSNVAAFQHLFKERQGDKMVEFDVGNPESVIQRIQSSVEDPPQTANIHNDKLAFEVPDQMREIRLGRKFDDPVKLAHEDVPERKLGRDMAVQILRKMASELKVERYHRGHAWEAAMDKLAKEFKKAHGYGADFEVFMKSAFAEHGMDAVPEISHLAHDVLHLKLLLPSAEKVAHLQDRYVSDDTAELALLKEALDARHAYVKVANGLEWINKNLPQG
jgi:hypothetical protein